MEMYPILLAVGMSAIWAGYRSRDEVYRLAWMVVSSLALGWGYLITPAPIQLLSLALVLGYWPLSRFKIDRS